MSCIHLFKTWYFPAAFTSQSYKTFPHLKSHSKPIIMHIYLVLAHRSRAIKRSVYPKDPISLHEDSVQSVQMFGWLKDSLSIHDATSLTGCQSTDLRSGTTLYTVVLWSHWASTVTNWLWFFPPNSLTITVGTKLQIMLLTHVMKYNRAYSLYFKFNWNMT